ncbi:MAG: ABC transporter permease [Rhizobiaceae bacterium]|nr:ABC transporter permease [Rhizobiaceae bacterium]
MTDQTIAERSALPLAANASLIKWVRNYAIVIFVALFFVILTIIAPNFASARNIFNVLDQNAPLMLTAMGTTLVIMTGGFDLSSGKILSLAGVVGAKVAVVTGSAIAGVAVGIFSGIPAGMLNGFLVGRLKLNSFLLTLATGLLLSGIAMFVTAGYSFDLSGNAAFRYLGSTRYGIVPLSVIVCAIVFVLLTILMRYTVVGRQILAVGSNTEAARLSGLSVGRVKLIAYAIGGAAAATGGMILTTRTGVGGVYTDAPTLTLNAIAAVVIGGTAITGGSGAIWRTVLGVLLLALTRNALNLLNIPPYWQEAVSGLIIIIALLANTRR